MQHAHAVELRRELDAVRTYEQMKVLAARYHADEATTSSLVDYVHQQRVATGTVPDEKHLIVEQFRDEMDSVRVVLHAPFGGRVNAPWGMALAPSSFGAAAGKLLVGNFGDGTIHIVDPSNGTVMGTLQSAVGGQQLTIDGLWALVFNTDADGGISGPLYFSAGPNSEANGVFGTLTPANP